MAETDSPTRRRVIITIALLLSLTTVSSLTYLYIKDARRSRSSQRFHTLRKHLISQLVQVEEELDQLVRGDLRWTQVRVKTLRTHPLFPGDRSVKLPSLGLIPKEGNNNRDSGNKDSDKLGMEVEETQEELIRERSQGYEDPVQVRKAYQELEPLIKSIQERLLKWIETVETIGLDELVEVGDLGTLLANDSEIQALEKIRRRKRTLTVKVQKTMVLLDQLKESVQERTLLIIEFEQLEQDGLLGPTTEVQPTIDNELMKAGLSFAEVVALNVKEPEVLAPTEDLDKMKTGISYADMARRKSVVVEEEPVDIREEHTLTFVAETSPARSLPPSPSSVWRRVEEDDMLAPTTTDQELMKEGVIFAHMASNGIPEPEALLPTEDLNKMKQGLTIASVVSEE